ncbi:MAG: peptidoglycan editing factor PgeF [Haliea sp.]|nr:MAG: peptidoglycan editing factor PgeF [Haliea sp.]
MAPIGPSADWLVPTWPAPQHVQAVCTTRQGGVSRPPYDRFNLGDHVGDDPASVASNRQALGKALQARPVFLNQVHRWNTVALDASASDAIEADACVATQPGVACTIMVADCLPVLFCDADGTAVAAAHAGWRGLAGEGGQGVLEAILERFWALVPVPRAQAATKTIAWLGPCIGPTAFEVGPEVKAAFEARDPQAAGYFQPHSPGKWLADLQGLARLRLAALGVTQVYGNDGSAAWCTVGNPSRFFSHRRDRISGRFAAAVWLEG